MSTELALEVKDLVVAYGGIKAVKGISLEVKRGEIVTLIGSNGAGKTSTLRGIVRLVKAGGSVRVFGTEVSGLETNQVAGLGVALVPEGRGVFTNMTVRENLELGAYLKRDKAGMAQRLERVIKLFPRLGERMKQDAGTLSGGEQQMLAIGRALMTTPKLLVLDEPSLGLAPKLIEQIRDIIVDINKLGTSVLLIEQNAMMAMSIASYGYIMETGKIVMDGDAAKLRSDEDVKEFYLGLHGEDSERSSFRDVKHYKRRKRWAS